MNSKFLTLLLVIFGLLLAALISHTGDPVWMTLPFLAYLIIGILQAPVTGTLHLQAQRTVEKDLSAGGTSVEVTVIVRNQGGKTVHLFLSDPLQPGMRITSGEVRTLAALPPGNSATLQYTFQSGRAGFTWTTVRAAVSDPFGLIELSQELPAFAQVQVLPDLQKFRPFPLKPQHTLPSAGSIPARLGGSGTEFFGVREYHPGDPLRRLDWRRTARHPHQLFTREYEQEQIADIGLVLDARQKTDLGPHENSLFEYSVRAAASLSEVFLRQGNRVSLLIYGRRIVSLFPGYGKEHLNRIMHQLSQAVPESGGSLDSLQFIPLQTFSSHSLILVLSPLAPNDWRLFPRLRAYGYQVLLVSPDPVDYARRMLPSDPVTRLAARLTQVERHLEIGKITRLWIPVIDWQVDQPLAPLVRAVLSRPHALKEP
jgi:uncharacterized protein (DUF58 family)